MTQLAESTSGQGTQPDRHIESLTGLRGLAVLMVFISHASNTGYLPGFLGQGYGQLGVMLFFVLSGFLMAHLYLDSPPDKARVRAFAWSRAARVLPLYVLVVLVSVALTELEIGFRYEISAGWDLWRHLLLVTGDYELWTIPVEIQFYVVFVIAWLVWSRLRSVLALIVVLVVVTLPAIPLMAFTGDRPDIISAYAFSFAAGCGLSIIMTRASQLVLRIRPLLDRYGLLFLGLLLLNLPALRDSAGLGLGSHPYLLTWYDPLSWILILIVFAAAATDAESLRLLRNKALLHLGGISYGFYLFHHPLLSATESLMHGRAAVVGWAGALVVLAVVIGLAALSRRVIEKPASAYVRRRYVGP